MNLHADDGSHGIDDGIFGFEGVAVGDDPGGFVDEANGCHQGRYQDCRLPGPAEPGGETNPGAGREMRDPVQEAGESMPCGGDAAECKKEHCE